MLLPAAFLCLISPPAAPSPAPVAPLPGQDERAPAGDEAGLRAELDERLAAADYEGARRTIERLIVLQAMTRARALLAAGAPREALPAIDRALELAPKDREVVLLRARAAEAAAPTDSQPGFFYLDATRYYDQAYELGLRARGGKPGLAEFETTLAACRTARLIPDAERACERGVLGARIRDYLARQGTPVDDAPLLRAWAEASFDRYLAAREAGADTAALHAETADLLAQHAGRRPADTWALIKLADLALWEGDAAAALAQLELALEMAPDDAELHARLIRQLEAGPDGRAAVIARYETFTAARPESALGAWYLGDVLFRDAFARMGAEWHDEGQFAAAERWFRRCRELQPEFASSCQPREASCRSGIGWCHYWADDVESAVEAFRSMEEVLPGGMRVGSNDALPNGLAGIDFCIRKLYAGGGGDVSTEDLVWAAELAESLHRYDPTDPDLANNAGFQYREAAMRFRESDMPRAVALMEKSWAAYEVAVRLAPADVRIVNDAGLVMTYYLRTDAALAERLLLQAIETGTPQVAELDADTDEGARDALLEAYGDAHQNLAVLHYTIHRDPVAARRWLERCLEVDPRPTRRWMRAEIEALQRAADGASGVRSAMDTMVWLERMPAR